MRPSAKIRSAAVLAAAAAVVGLISLGSCGRSATAPDHATPQAFALAAIPPRPPMAFFEQACAGCHGPFGMFYGETFAATQDDAALRKTVREMVEGPGQSSLDGHSMDALVAFHRALRQRSGGPFIVVTGLSGRELRGEASPGAIIEARIDRDTVPADLDGFEWRIELPARWPYIQTLRIHARDRANGTVTEVDAAVSAFSHAN